jgi:general secretion pathway protein G
MENMMKMQQDRQKGFTLIEVMVVVAILGLLAAMVVPNLIGRDEEARVNKAKQDISSLENALDLYRLDNFAYPSTDQGLEALVEKPSGSPEPKRYKEGGYIKKLPTDPWGNPYQYLRPGTHGATDVYSFGPDQTPSDDDIGNWNLDK